MNRNYAYFVMAVHLVPVACFHHQEIHAIIADDIPPLPESAIGISFPKRFPKIKPPALD